MNQPTGATMLFIPRLLATCHASSALSSASHDCTMLIYWVEGHYPLVYPDLTFK